MIFDGDFGLLRCDTVCTRRYNVSEEHTDSIFRAPACYNVIIMHEEVAESEKCASICSTSGLTPQ
jgi:hypothetical protein